MGAVMLPANKLENVRRRADRARKWPANTCAASRLVYEYADALARGKQHWLAEEEPETVAADMFSVLENLWKLRTKLARLKP